MKEVRDNLPRDAIFGIDCSWSGRRNASHAIVIFMEMRSKLIFDKVIISKDEKVSDFPYSGPSNLMENAAVLSKRDMYVSNYRFIGFVHDYDSDTAPILHPDPLTGQLIEYLDPGHLKRTLENIFKSHNTQHELWQLKEHILNRFLYIVRKKNLTTEERLNLWYETPDYIIKSGIKTGYLTNTTKSKDGRKYTTKEARAFLVLFLHETAWLVEKCSFFDTQAIESWNSSCKNKLAPKGIAYHESFRIRNLIGIIKWNNPIEWFDILYDEIVGEDLCDTCKNILINDVQKKERERSKAQQEETKKLRNKNRRLARLKNRINPSGHQYAIDNKEDKRLKDPTRKVACTLLPHIDNTNSCNCFINSVIQLLRYTNPEKNMQLAKNDVVSIMLELNKGNNIKLESINMIRHSMIPTFSLCGQEDAHEFLIYLMNLLFSNRQKISCLDPLIKEQLAHEPETEETKCFRDAYQFEIVEIHRCNTCNKVISEIQTQEYSFSIPVQSSTFEVNMYAAQNDTSVKCMCSFCKSEQECTVTRIFKKSSTFLTIHFLRFCFDIKSGSPCKINTEVNFPDTLFVQGRYYNLIGVIYHIGSGAQSGHYLTKHLNYNGSIETLDDSRCYINPTEKSFIRRNAYMLLYQEQSSRQACMPSKTVIEQQVAEAFDICRNKKNQITMKEKLESNTCIRIKIPIVVRDEFVKLIRKNSHLCSLHLFDKLQSPEKLTSNELTYSMAELIVGIFNFYGFKNKEKIICDFFKELINSHCMTTPTNRFLEAYFIAADSFPEECYSQNSNDLENLGQKIISTLNALIEEIANNKIDALPRIIQIYSSSHHNRNNKYFPGYIQKLAASI